MKKYFKDLFDLFSFNNIIVESSLFGILIILIEIYDYIIFSLERGFLFIIILLFILVFINFFNKENFNKIFSNGINEFDKYCFEFLIILVIYISYVLLFEFCFYKLKALFALLVIYMIILLIRNNRNKKNNIHLKNTLDFCDIYENKIDLSEYNDIVLFKETEINYDLLNRTSIINNLYNIIIRTNPSTAFTIGLNGKWGSGKTTIVNNVLKKIEENDFLKNYVVIKFDPWVYDDEKMMLESLINDILKNINFNMFNLNKFDIIQGVMDSIFTLEKNNYFSFIFDQIRKNNKKVSIRKIVNNYLNSNNKRLIIIIDNLDRIDGEKAIFLIKCLNTVFNFNNTVNLLLYDEEIINNVLNEKFNSKSNYMEKFVQLKIEIPLVDKNEINKIKYTISNNLLYRNKKIIDFIKDDIYDFENIRELKRFVNLIISIEMESNHKLNNVDYSILKYIQLNCPDLYYEIWYNKKYYVLYDRKYDFELFSFNYDSLNDDAKKYFENLYNTQKYKKHLKYIEKLFPNINKDNIKNACIFSSHYDEKKYHDSVLNNHISNARFFDLYFTNSDNEFLKLNEDVYKLVDCINDNNINFSNLLKFKIKNYSPDEMKVFFEIFQLILDSIRIEKYSMLIKSLIEILPNTEDRVIFGEFDSRERIYIIISKLLVKMSKNDFNKVSKCLFNNYKNLFMLYRIKYLIDLEKNKGAKCNFDFDIVYNNFCNKVFEESIDIYDNNNYCRGNIWALYNFNKEKTQKYLNKVIKSENIYLLLNDLISISSGTRGYGYLISDDAINKLLPDIDINYYIDTRGKNLNKKEKFIKNVYFKSINNKDPFEKGVYYSEYYKL